MVVTASRDIEAAHAAAHCVVQTHQRLVEFLRAGLTLAQIDAFVGQTLHELDCRSAFLNYKIHSHPPFPSHSCLSLNDCIVHGTHIMTSRPLASGDVLSIDIGVIHEGFIGDAAWTYAIGSASDEAMRLMKCGRECLRRGLAALKVGRPLIDWAKAVQGHAERESGFHLIRGLGGHGYGRKLHGPPFVSNVLPAYHSEWPDAWKLLKPGMLMAVEPMVAAGTAFYKHSGNDWPLFTQDGSLAVHYEADVLMTNDGAMDLTEGMQDLPDVVG